MGVLVGGSVGDGVAVAGEFSAVVVFGKGVPSGPIVLDPSLIPQDASPNATKPFKESLRKSLLEILT